MAQENVEQFMKATEAFNRADVEGFVKFVDPEVRYEPVQAALQGAYVGYDGVREWFADVSEHYVPESWEVSYTEIRDLGEAVLGIGWLSFTAKGSGIATRTPVAFLAEFRDGLVIRLRDYGEREKGLEAAGLAE
jgi:ketosteroid isomerase-like protein